MAAGYRYCRNRVARLQEEGIARLPGIALPLVRYKQADVLSLFFDDATSGAR